MKSNINKRLVVNADDYGMAIGVNRGIIDGHQNGIITSTTIMATGKSLDDGVARLKDAPKLGLGCHLVLIGETPVSPLNEVRSLVDGSGHFPRTLTQFIWAMSARKIKPAEIVHEFRAQIEKLMSKGITISHCDSHKHSHAHPVVLDAVIQVAEEFKIRYIRNPFERCNVSHLRKVYGGHGEQAEVGRKYLLSKMLVYYRTLFQRRMRHTSVRCPDHFQGFVATGHLSPELLPKLLTQVSTGISELMCHPAQLDGELRSAATRLKESRERELAALTAEQTRAAIAAQGIDLTTFRELAQELG